MADLPKIAQARLRSQQAAADSGIHPDANLLSAFVEGSLAASERSEMFAHLSNCADCREVVALSLPELDASMVQRSAAPATSWITNLAMMRWTAVAAAIVIVGAAVMLMNPKQSDKSVISNDNYAPATQTPAVSAPQT